MTYTVISARQTDIYHFHGSWFEYDFQMNLKDEDGNIVSAVLSTWDNPDMHNKFIGKKIKITKGYFRVVR